MHITKLQSQIDHMAQQLFDKECIKMEEVYIRLRHTEFSDSNERVETISTDITITPLLDNNSGGGGGGGGGGG